jgi:pimeloyl-ACP methyl ester carboxylesterase
MFLKTIAGLSLALSVCATAHAAASEIQIDRHGIIKGTLELPARTAPVPVVLLIAGSGPTDRNGNGPGVTNDSYRQLADALAAHGIASVRYDKRGIAASAAAATSEAGLTIEQYADDAGAWLTLLEQDARFSKVVVVGHSEGALVGLLAARQVGANGYVSLAGAGERASMTLRRQLAGKLPPTLAQENERILTALEQGKPAGAVPPALAALYRPSVQPYLISWFKYDPAAELSKLTTRALLIQGSSDLQVTVDDARKLEHGRPGTPVVIVDGMNHVLKMAQGDLAAQTLSYTTPGLPVAPALVTALAGFVNTQ